MIHKNLLSCLGVLVACMAMGVLSQEPSSPWQAINPALSIGSSQEEYSETSYEVEYPEGQNNTNYEEDELYDILHSNFHSEWTRSRQTLL
ncbi:hypothetical protein SK128_017707 [Halocaridina rubra]|uniref:Uncharacterized protein n=1 Tax=Halocaridina rubra TaxID=373956 RepID=A0AAN9A303_HALRR